MKKILEREKGRLRIHGRYPLIVLKLSFNYTEPLLRLCRTSLLIELNLSFDFSEMPSPQR